MGNNYWLMVIGLLVVYAVVLYFLSIRPQKKQEKKMQAMLDSLEVGDSVETSAGLFGVVIDISGDILIVEFGGDRHCRIPMRRQAVVNIEKANSVEE
ncbi:MAG: preprotein translocase subunit YajC [Frisingicoccus sp.]|uniref:preprotein translocase subunit YajC n=1 Tax=Frisingicoccus sp. TaxID=1918627 RepID=UPI0025B95A19|nr:preprotein translocase subunit YajC [Frisingicoccus sp.]MDD6232242.1 preprotein translocase subunit YajC [Frisingicoccus sp.]MDY4834984.1 preprotein translocase subunit YajC [Frisingicoccus sp.]MDY5956544.1 preprotein translocase subunit YajC [Frisingicoccus sp.]